MFGISKAPRALVALGIALAPLPGRAQAQGQPPHTLTSVSVNLPTGNRVFAGGKTAEAVNANCLTCHSAGMVLNQPNMPKAAWDTEVHKMINVYKAPVPAKDVPAIVAYLSTAKGTPETR